MLGLLALLIPAALASAQAVSTAQMNGTVRDGSGGALPGVTVTATQTATGLKRETTTDERGLYVLANLPIGPYQLDVTLRGWLLMTCPMPGLRVSTVEALAWTEIVSSMRPSSSVTSMVGFALTSRTRPVCRNERKPPLYLTRRSEARSHVL